MKVIISAGGTGGHIYPALAIVEKIKQKEPDSTFLYIGTHDRMEKDIIPNYGIPYEPIEIYGFNRQHLLKNIKVLKALRQAKKKCKKLIQTFDPDVVIGVGGYVTAPVISSAKKLGYKTFIHEQNSVPGKANRYLSQYADKIGISFPSSRQYFPKEKVVLTGNPCSESAKEVMPCDKREFGLSNQKKLVLFVMGSLGASKVNDFLIKTMSLFNQKNYEVLYVTGKGEYDKISKLPFPNNVKVVPYIEKMTRVMKKTDLIVTRAGASTLSEIIALEVPSIIIPSPYVTNNHQYKNAMDLVHNKAAIMIEEKDLKGDILIRQIDSFFQNPVSMQTMRENLRNMQVKQSATKIYETLRKLIDRK